MPVAVIDADVAPKRSSEAKSSTTTETPSASAVPVMVSGVAGNRTPTCPSGPPADARATASPSSSASTTYAVEVSRISATQPIAASSRSPRPRPASASALSSFTAVCCTMRRCSASRASVSRDRQRDQVGKPREALLGRVRDAARLRGVDTERAPQAPADVHGHGDALDQVGQQHPGPVRPSHARRDAGAVDGRGGVRPGEVELRSHAEAGHRRRRPQPGDQPVAVVLEPHDGGGVDAEQERHLARDDVGDRGDVGTRGDELGHPLQGILLGAQSQRLVPRLRPRGDVLGEADVEGGLGAVDANDPVGDVAECARPGVDDAVLVRPGADLGARELVPPAGHALAVVGVHDGRPAMLAPLVDGLPRQLRPAARDRDRATVRRVQPGRHGQRVDGGRELFLLRQAERPGAGQERSQQHVHAAWIAGEACHVHSS